MGQIRSSCPATDSAMLCSFQTVTSLFDVVEKICERKEQQHHSTPWTTSTRVENGVLVT